MKYNRYKLGDLIRQRREKFDKSENLPIRGVSREGFIPPKQEDADTSIYNVFYKYDFIFNPARMELNSITINLSFDKAICSSLYEIFYVVRKDLLLPEYLYLYVKREEFARKCWFEAVGSARNYFRVSNLSDFDIELPPLPVQEKYVNIYRAMIANQKSYERGLEDLKLVCDGYIEDLRRRMPCEKIGPYIELKDERNSDGAYTLNDLKGISIRKTFIASKADMKDVSLTPYIIVKPGFFAYVTVTSRNGEKITLAYNNTENAYIVSSSYVVFSVKNPSILNSEYLFMFFNRPEFDRYARFNSWGSAREVFSWEALCDVKIPIPGIKIQKAISNIYAIYLKRVRINEKMQNLIKDVCSILISGSLLEGKML